MAVGTTTTGSLADSLDDIVASARSRREYDGVVTQLVDKKTLDPNTGTSWKEALFEQLEVTAVTEQTENDNAQQFVDSAITVTPSMFQIVTCITDKVRRNLNRASLAQMGKLAGQAMVRNQDEQGLTAMDGSTTVLGTAGATVTTNLITAARYRISSNATERGMPPYNAVFHGYILKSLANELTASVGSSEVTSGITAEVLKSGFKLPISSVNIYEDGNVTIDSSSDAKGFVFAKDAWILVRGLNIRTETERKPGRGGGADLVYLTEEFAFGERSAGNWSYEILGDAATPTS